MGSLSCNGRRPASSQKAQRCVTRAILQMVAANRGITALPKWLIDEDDSLESIAYRSLGEKGIRKTLYLGHRKTADTLGFVDEFIEMAKRHDPKGLQA